MTICLDCFEKVENGKVCECHAGFGAPDIVFRAADCPVHQKAKECSKCRERNENGKQ